MSEFAGVMASLGSGGDSSASADSGSTETASPSVATTESTSSADADVGAPPSSGDEGPLESGTAEPAAPSQPTTAKPVPQTVPYARLSEVVAERNALREQAQRVQWAAQIPADHAPYLTQLYQDLRSDPVGTLLREIEALAANGDPTAAQSVRSAAARWLRQGRQTGAPDPTEVDLTPRLSAETGEAVYTADQVEALVAQQVQAQVEALRKQMQPLEQDVQERKVQQIVTEIKAKAKAQAEEIRAYPHFAEHKAEILALLKADRSLSPEKAWMQVVLPKLTQAQQKQAVQALHAKAQAGSVIPGRAPAAPPTTATTSFAEAMRMAREEASRSR